MASRQIERIQKKLIRIRHLDPHGQVLFGAEEHKYQFNSPAPVELVQAFEEQHQLRLPEGYREFVLNVGNGGSGPYYGLYELRTITQEERDKAYGSSYDENHPEWQSVRLSSFSSLPEHFAGNSPNYKFTSNEEHEEALMLFLDGIREGAVTVGTQGCSLDTLLVTNGPCCGQMWTYDYEALHDSLTGFWPETACSVERLDLKPWPTTNWSGMHIFGINPFSRYFLTGSEESGLLFLDWIEHWLDTGLYFIERSCDF